MALFVNGVQQGAGLGNVVEDLTPQLGGNLDANGSNVTGIGNIGFLAAQAPSAGANDLDDYEEGTFTPVLWDISLANGEGQVYAVQVGRYVKIGRQVFIWIELGTTSLGTLTQSNGANIGGLPFTSANIAGTLGSSFHMGRGTGLAIVAGQTPSARINPNVSYLSVHHWRSTAGVATFLLSAWTADGTMILSGHYEV